MTNQHIGRAPLEIDVIESVAASGRDVPVLMLNLNRYTAGHVGTSRSGVGVIVAEVQADLATPTRTGSPPSSTSCTK